MEVGGEGAKGILTHEKERLEARYDPDKAFGLGDEQHLGDFYSLLIIGHLLEEGRIDTSEVQDRLEEAHPHLFESVDFVFRFYRITGLVDGYNFAIKNAEATPAH